MYLVLRGRELVVVLADALVVRPQELEGLGYAGHGLCSSLDDVSEAGQAQLGLFVVLGEQEADLVVNLLLELLVLDALSRCVVTRSSSFFLSFFLSLMGADLPLVSSMIQNIFKLFILHPYTFKQQSLLLTISYYQYTRH